MTYVVYEFASFGSLVLNDDHGKQGPGGIEVLTGLTNQVFFYWFFVLLSDSMLDAFEALQKPKGIILKKTRSMKFWSTVVPRPTLSLCSQKT